MKLGNDSKISDDLDTQENEAQVVDSHTNLRVVQGFTSKVSDIIRALQNNQIQGLNIRLLTAAKLYGTRPSTSVL